MKAFPVLYASSLLLGAFPLNGESLNDVHYHYTNRFDQIVVPPIGGYDVDIDIYFSMKEDPTESVLIDVILKSESNPKGTLLKQIFSYERAGKVTYTFNRKDLLNYQNDYFAFKLSYKIVGDNAEVRPKYRNYRSLAPKTDEQTYNLNKNIALFKVNEGTTYYNEVIKVKGCKNIFITDKEGFDPSLFSFQSINLLDNSDVGKASLIIDGSINPFGNIGTNIYDSYYVIDMEPIVLDGVCRFKSAKQLYYHKRTHEMTETYKIPYIKTDVWYFNRAVPRDRAYTMSLGVEEFGVNHSLITYNFSIVITDKIMGNCTDSDYCIKVDDGEATIDLGEVISR